MLKSVAITNIGQKRKLNQDSFYTSDGPVGRFADLYIVADGMGGHKAGDYASRYAVDNVVGEIQSARDHNDRKVIEKALVDANRGLRKVAAGSEEYSGMGTTIVAATINDGKVLAANVGDSRLYIVGKEGNIRQITVDHSLVEEMILAGGLDKIGARNHPDKNIITRAIGGDDDLTIDYFEENLVPGDTVLMCTDGLTNMVDDDRIAEIIALDTTDDEKARILVNEANRNGGRDNITVILIDPYYTV